MNFKGMHDCRELTLVGLLKSPMRFMWISRLAVLRQIALPSVLVPTVLYITGVLYVWALKDLLNGFNERVASLVLAIPVIALLLITFISSYPFVGIARLVLESSDLRLPEIARPHWRMFSACLRFLLLAVIVALPEMIVIGGKATMLLSPYFTFALGIITATGLSYLMVRLFLMIAPLSLMERGSILRRGWKLTGRVHGFAVILFVALAGVVLLAEAAGEALVRSAWETATPTAGWTLPAMTSLLQETLPVLIGGIALAYSVGVILFSVASAYLYRLTRNSCGSL